MQIRPEHQPRDFLNRMKHVVVVIPIDTQVDEAQHVAQEDGDHWPQSLEALAMGHLHLQHHDGDEDGDHAITERFKPIPAHSACARAHRNCHFTKSATAEGNEKITRTTGSSSRNTYTDKTTDETKHKGGGHSCESKQISATHHSEKAQGIRQIKQHQEH